MTILRCKYCGAILRSDQDGPYCPTKNCQWSLTGSGYKENVARIIKADVSEGISWEQKVGKLLKRGR